MQIDIQLVGKPNHWSYKQRRIRIGRDSSCDVSLQGQEFAVVSREHVVIEVNGETATFSDQHSANGTFLNGQRVSAGTLRSGDKLRLGADGPELQVRLIETQTVIAGNENDRQRAQESAATQVATVATFVGSAATVVAEAPAGAPASTVVSSAGSATATVVAREPASTIVAKPNTDHPTIVSTEKQERGVRVAFGSEGKPATKIESTPHPPVTNKISEIGDEQVIERKLNSIRTLLAANLAVMLVLLLGLFYESQQIDRNRKDLSEMRLQAQTAVGQFTPALDARLNTFEKRMDSVDGKMKDAEDRLVVRMNKEIPTMLDKYVDEKVNQAKRQSVVRP